MPVRRSIRTKKATEKKRLGGEDVQAKGKGKSEKSKVGKKSGKK